VVISNLLTEIRIPSDVQFWILNNLFSPSMVPERTLITYYITSPPLFFCYFHYPSLRLRFVFSFLILPSVEDLLLISIYIHTSILEMPCFSFYRLFRDLRMRGGTNESSPRWCLWPTIRVTMMTGTVNALIRARAIMPLDGRWLGRQASEIPSLSPSFSFSFNPRHVHPDHRVLYRSVRTVYDSSHSVPSL